MKKLLTPLLFILFPFCLFAQDISGLWSGVLVNDSMKRRQQFEMGLSEYRGKITGYTYTTFIENDTFYYSIKRVKAERRDNVLVVEDVEMVSNNFPARVSKGVHQTTTFPLINDSTIDISRGTWSTNKTKKYYSISGNTALQEQKESKSSDLVAHLDELKIKNTIATKSELIARTNVPTRSSAMPQKEKVVARTNTTTPVTIPQQVKKEPQQTSVQQSLAKNEEKKNVVEPPIKKEPASLVKQENKNTTPVVSNVAVTSVASTQVPTIQKPNKSIVEDTKAEDTKAITTMKNQPEEKSIPVAQAEKQVIQNVQPVSTASPIASIIQPLHIKELPDIVATRKTNTMQDVYFKGDSLVLALYDNGIVDGDTVSVFLNGENIFSRQKLKEYATKKTIYITRDMPDSLELVLFAENLGTIPPNTGLLTIRDGDDLYQVRFSADLNTNAAVVLRRRK
jgi:hypothetical protein